MKLLQSNIKSIRKESLPVRGAWIEIAAARTSASFAGRSPCGERGLKFECRVVVEVVERSLPVRGAWIEMAPVGVRWLRALVAPRAGSVD